MYILPVPFAPVPIFISELLFRAPVPIYISPDVCPPAIVRSPLVRFEPIVKEVIEFTLLDVNVPTIFTVPLSVVVIVDLPILIDVAVSVPIFNPVGP